ncbi:MAG: hypothetical protein IKR86_01095 [Candidatus Methanomethylophilaceae archaeon]|nr:hypothetical protein [Candidatus Methanomethylophilaceae archaeon]
MKVAFCDGYDWEEGRRFADEHRHDAPAGTAACNRRLLGIRCRPGREEKVVIVPACVGRRGSLGVSPVGMHSALLATEGVNDAGLACSISDICVESKGTTGGTASGKDRLSASMIVRFLLDGADSVSGAVRMLSEKDIYCSGDECHLLLCDKTRSAAVEFIDDRMTVTYGSNVLAGFYVSGFETEADLSGRACGLDEYRRLERSVDSAGSPDAMISLLSGSGPLPAGERASAYDLEGLGLVLSSGGETYRFSLRPRQARWTVFALSANPQVGLNTRTGDSNPRNHNGPKDP